MLTGNTSYRSERFGPLGLRTRTVLIVAAALMFAGFSATQALTASRAGNRVESRSEAVAAQSAVSKASPGEPILTGLDAAATDRSALHPATELVAIEQLQVMQDRVLADNPLDDETESPLGEIDPEEWRVVVLEHVEGDGTRHMIEQGVPLQELTAVSAEPSSASDDFEFDDAWQSGDPLPEYFDESGFPIDPKVIAAALQRRSSAHDATSTPSPKSHTIGSTIFVDLPEHGISADFTVKEIRPCPKPNSGDGYLVTTKFTHENAEILNLRIEGADKSIGTTASHPFWSEDRQQFVPAGELRIGENLLLADDSRRRVESLTRRETRETVYNIEIDGEHVFYVGEDGVLVHNNCWNDFQRLNSGVFASRDQAAAAYRARKFIASHGGAAPHGFKGGRQFLNDGRNGGQILDQFDALGRRITYREYDIRPHIPGVNRGRERLVIGSDGRSYFTTDHYFSFRELF